MRIRHRPGADAILRSPLMRAGWTLRQLPIVLEEVLEEGIAPSRRRRGPGDFEAAGDGIAAFAGAEFALPAETLLLDARPFGLCTHQRRIAGAVGLAEGVTAGDERDRFLIVHGHASKGFANVSRRRERIGLAIGPFRIDVDETHLHGAQRMLKITVAAIALVRQPLAFGTPVDLLLGLPRVRATAAKAERLEAH